jgi:hypothetical protein
MTPARERLVRLALAMPEEAVEVIAKTSVWICPGLENATGPAFVKDKAELMLSLALMAQDPELQRLTLREVRRLAAMPVPEIPSKPDNVVALFSEGRAQP